MLFYSHISEIQNMVFKKNDIKSLVAPWCHLKKFGFKFHCYYFCFVFKSMFTQSKQQF